MGKDRRDVFPCLKRSLLDARIKQEAAVDIANYVAWSFFDPDECARRRAAIAANLIVKCKPVICFIQEATSYLIAELQRRKYFGTMCSASNEVPNPEKRQVVVAIEIL